MTTRTYLVSFNKAERTLRGTYRITFDVGTPNVTHMVEAADFPTLETEVRRLADAFGTPCSPYVRLKTKGDRKPAGFDAWVHSINVIDPAAQEA